MNRTVRTCNRQSIGRVALAGAIACLSSMMPASVADSAGPEQGNLCWPASRIGLRPGEERIQKEVPGAFRAAPSRTPAAFTPIPRQERQVIRRVTLPPGQKMVAFTFDLCEQPHEVSGYQGEIVDYLRAQNIKATFFAGGKWMITHPERAQQLMSDPLFEVGNHTWEHRNLRLLTGASLTSEIAHAQAAYEQVREELVAKRCLPRDGRKLRAPERMSLLRFPFGACNAQALEATGQLGLHAVQWDVSSGDPWPGQKPDLMARAVLAKVQPGSIILFHANGRGWHTPSALPAIVQGLQAQGYAFVTVSELLTMGKPVYAPTCYDSQPGDTDRYDALARRLEDTYALARQKVLSAPASSRGDPAVAPRPTPQ